MEEEKIAALEAQIRLLQTQTELENQSQQPQQQQEQEIHKNLVNPEPSSSSSTTTTPEEEERKVLEEELLLILKKRQEFEIEKERWIWNEKKLITDQIQLLRGQLERLKQESILPTTQIDLQQIDLQVAKKNYEILRENMIKKAKQDRRNEKELKLKMIELKDQEELAECRKKLDQIAQKKKVERFREELRKIRQEGEAVLEEEQRLNRMKELQEQIDQMDARIIQQDKIELDKKKPNWHSPFSRSFQAFQISFVLKKDFLSQVRNGTQDFIDIDSYLEEKSRKLKRFSIHPKPFAVGAFRYAYYFRGDNERKKSVGKHLIDQYKSPVDELIGLKEGVALHLISSLVVNSFNERKPSGVRGFKIISSKILDAESEVDAQREKTRRYWSVEHSLQRYGEERFRKYNNNKDQFDEDYEEPQSLSHFSYELFNMKMMMVDVQGILAGDTYVITDPAFHTHKGEMRGGSDLGKSGFKAFFGAHKCNYVCRAMNLAPVGFN